MSHDHPGQGPTEGRQDPDRGRDEFDHFFSDRRVDDERQDPDATAWQGGSRTPFSSNDATDPDATAWSGAATPGYDGDPTQAVGHPSYVRPAQPQYDDYAPADGGGYDYAPAGKERYVEPAPTDQGYHQHVGDFAEPRRRRGAVWAPIAVIVASLAIVAVVVAIIVGKSSGRMTEGAFTPTATVTRTTTQDVSPSQSSSSGDSSSSSSPSPSSTGPSDAAKLPGDASKCPGSSRYRTGPRTSCGFAGVVATLYGAKKDDHGDASFKAKSPETHHKYAVSCHSGSYVTCTTETGAVIYILRG